MASRIGIGCITALALLVSVSYVYTGSISNDAIAASEKITVADDNDGASSLPDFDGDGNIGFGDFVLFAGVFGSSQGDEEYNARYDLNGDGEIGFTDFVIFAQDFGKDVPSPEVSIPDDNLRAAIETALGKASGAPITQAEMATLDSLTAVEKGISDLTGLEYATDLTWLDLASNNVTDISVLGGLTNLTGLNLSENNIPDLASLVGNNGLGKEDKVDVRNNPLNAASHISHIPALQARGVSVSFVPSPVVSIPDANLRAAIEDVLDKASGAPITQAEMATLDSLEANESAIENLTGLESATNLTYLSLNDNNIEDIFALSSLANLNKLWLSQNPITDISKLAGLTNLKELWLRDNRIEDISPLSVLTNLGTLWLDQNNITDLSPLYGLTNLTELSVGEGPISDLSPLSGLSRLRLLLVFGTSNTDLSPLSGLINLRELGLNHGEIEDISALAGLTNLRRLNLFDNRIEDISALSGLTNLTHLTCSKNRVSDISALSGLTNLTELWLTENNIKDVSPLSGLINLIWLGLDANSIEDISPLSGLTNLYYLGLSANNIEDISPLSSLTNLYKLELRGNPYETLPKGDFDIELVLLDDFTESQKNVLQYVARRWMAVVTKDLPDYEFTEGWSGGCGSQSFEIPAGERIDDLRIYVVKPPSVVGPHGFASLRVLREATHLPVIGCMGFDLSHANLLITGLHEIGHVLGVGTRVWDNLGFRQDPNGDEHFNGPLAIAAFDDAGGRNYTGAKVPVDGSHWRVGVFGDELMTPTGSRAISAITVQSLADLGYGVDVSQADPYTLTSATAGAKIATTLSSWSLPGGNITRESSHDPRFGDQDVSGEMPEARTPIDGYDLWRQRLVNAEAVWRRGVDFGNGGFMARLAPPVGAEPEFTCGAALEREPIYVVDPQGRVVRTIVR